MIEPTLTPANAARTTWDAVVIGAGPAGALSAYKLAQHGARVLLVDRVQFPRYKVCGGCLNPRALRFLQQAGLGDRIAALGAVPLSKLRLGVARRQADVPLPNGAGVARELLDAALVRSAIAAGAAFLPGAAATVVPPCHAELRHVQLREHLLQTRVILAAGGLASFGQERPHQPGSRIGAGVMLPTGTAGFERGIIYMACAPGGYVGQVMVGDGRIEVAAALDPVAVTAAGGIGCLAAQIVGAAGMPAHSELTSLPWKGTPRLTRRAPTLGGTRLFVLGDAAGYVEPFTGEGMGWAFAGALAVVPLVLSALHAGWHNDLLTRWQATHAREVSSRQAVCRLTAAILRRQWTTRMMVGVLARTPWLARPFIRHMYRA